MLGCDILSTEAAVLNLKFTMANGFPPDKDALETRHESLAPQQLSKGVTKRCLFALRRTRLQIKRNLQLTRPLMVAPASSAEFKEEYVWKYL